MGKDGHPVLASQAVRRGDVPKVPQSHGQTFGEPHRGTLWCERMFLWKACIFFALKKIFKPLSWLSGLAIPDLGEGEGV